MLRAVRIVRSRAAEFGGAAGSHRRDGRVGRRPLWRAWPARSSTRRRAAPDTPLDAVSARPDFVAAALPGGADGRAVRASRLDAQPAGRVARRRRSSPAPRSIGRCTRRCRRRSWCTRSADRSVPLENSLALYAALRRAGVPAELHVYEQGEHGFGVAARPRADVGGGRIGGSSWMRARRTSCRSARRRLPTVDRHHRVGRAAAGRAAFEGQRKADLGDGTFLNPILAGDHPDPSILKDGDDYYMTFSSFDAYPGLVDLALARPGELAADRPGAAQERRRGVGAGSRQARRALLHLLPGRRTLSLELRRLGRRHPRTVERADRSEDRPHRSRTRRRSRRPPLPVPERGLSRGRSPPTACRWSASRRRSTTAGRSPSRFVIEGFAQEGPKILRHGDYYYMVLAEGGTAGPPTGHMIVAARSRSIDGPWENSPLQPDRADAIGRRALVVARGTARSSKTRPAAGGWSTTPTRRGFLTLGRQTLLEPIDWTADGWFRVRRRRSRASDRQAGGPSRRR